MIAALEKKMAGIKAEESLRIERESKERESLSKPCFDVSLSHPYGPPPNRALNLPMAAYCPGDAPIVTKPT
jgi:hypothetical protein